MAPWFQADKSGDKALYGANEDRHEILDGKTPVPSSAKSLIQERFGSGHVLSVLLFSNQ
jgi:hypothetical protein